jgi:uncharacterized protein
MTVLPAIGESQVRPARALRIGLIADTHGLLRPEAAEFLRGSDHIVHAGDICDERTLEQISLIAPVTAVRGNNDKGAWAQALGVSELMRFADVFVYTIHDLAELDIEPRGQGIGVVVTGHTHQPRVEQRDGILFVNPGSAGRRRFSLPISVGELIISGHSVTARITELDVR